ncbi:MAG: hypothetical protein DRQ78_12300 [Epsilonproteobacteria bacterium]|nr:MAG: hypothetical protein DRQ78_12300 [Campylobacterota bacterium]
MIKIIPKDGLKVINPETLRRVSKDGVVVRKLNTFWKRRLEDGDITVEDLSKKSKSKKDTATKKDKEK